MSTWERGEPEVRRAEWGLAGGGNSDLGCGGAAVEKPGLAADQAYRDCLRSSMPSCAGRNAWFVGGGGRIAASYNT